MILIVLDIPQTQSLIRQYKLKEIYYDVIYKSDSGNFYYIENPLYNPKLRGVNGQRSSENAPWIAISKSECTVKN